MREVIVINPNTAPLHDKIRTAAYCRVSSDSDEQLASFSAQVSEYTARIQKNPDWVMADIYADEGISGVSAAKRPEFQRMMADCRRKKIDRILTKSISRFARNVKECIEYIRELQGLGVSIEFEKEGIDTAFLSGEMMIAVFGSLAQEESKSISSNMRLSYKSRMERGEFMGCTAPYGYRLDNGSLVIQTAESEIIQWIFSAYLMGYGQNRIIEQLMQQGIPAPNGGAFWNTEAISYILRNERYCGDSLFQIFCSVMIKCTPLNRQGVHNL